MDSTIHIRLTLHSYDPDFSPRFVFDFRWLLLRRMECRS
jgi:hypothetical protein